MSGGAVVRVRVADVRCAVGRSGKEWDGTLWYSQRTLEGLNGKSCEAGCGEA